MNYCPFGADCRDSKCEFEHNRCNMNMYGNYPPQNYHFQHPMMMNPYWAPGPPPAFVPGCSFRPGFHPHMNPHYCVYPPQCYMPPHQHYPGFGAHLHPNMPEPEVYQTQSARQCPINREEELPKVRKQKKGCKNKFQKCKKEKQPEDPIKEIVQKIEDLSIDEFNIKEGNEKMKECGFNDEDINKALLKHLGGDVEMAMRVMCEVQDDYSEEDIRDFVEVHKKYLIIKSLDFHYAFKRHKILNIMSKCHNDLGATLERLCKKQKILLKKNKHVEKLAALKEIYEEVIEQEIPKDCEFMIDGFNIVFTNKHLRKLFYSNNLKNKVQAIIRLRILVESLAEGYLVLDKKFLSDQQQREIEASIKVAINKPTKIKVVYADEDSIADEKILQILTGMVPERRNNVLLVTGDHELIQKSLHINGGKLMLMNGKKFIKQAKKLHDKGVRKSILIRRH